MSHNQSSAITEEWLRSVGFKWHQLERQPNKQWLLWIGGIAAISELPKLGMPTSPVPPIGDTLHRSFEHAEVWVDVPSRTAKIEQR